MLVYNPNFAVPVRADPEVCGLGESHSLYLAVTSVNGNLVKFGPSYTTPLEVKTLPIVNSNVFIKKAAEALEIPAEDIDDEILHDMEREEILDLFGRREAYIPKIPDDLRIVSSVNRYVRRVRARTSNTPTQAIRITSSAHLSTTDVETAFSLMPDVTWSIERRPNRTGIITLDSMQVDLEVEHLPLTRNGSTETMTFTTNSGELALAALRVLSMHNIAARS